MKTNPDYVRAKKLGLIHPEKSYSEQTFHPRSLLLMNFLADHDSNDYGNYFDWETGGDGDNGSILLSQISAFFDLLNLPRNTHLPPEYGAYAEAKKLKLVQKDRWSVGAHNHPTSVRLAEFIAEVDFNDYGDSFCWKLGGDGDNGQTLCFQMDAFFELLDLQQQYQPKPTITRLSRR